MSQEINNEMVVQLINELLPDSLGSGLNGHWKARWEQIKASHKAKEHKIYWAVFTKQETNTTTWEICPVYNTKEVLGVGGYTFDTKEQAEGWIALHKPKYSLMFILEALCNEHVKLSDRFNIRKLIEVWETKIGSTD